MKTSPTAAVRSQASAAPPTDPEDAPVTLTRANGPATSTPTFTQGIKTMINNPQDFVAFSEGNLEALTAAGKIWVAGVQDLTKQLAATAKESLEESVATAKALTSVKSIKEAIDLQSNYSKTAVAKALTESSKLTEASLKLTEQALAPLTARMAVAVGAFSKAA